ncbi:hypothetical protein HK104_005098 [Borealophlyctis nickersoniae]|nr:hypothetical protein HK104_005098 [Borealophlyctis nickersoniae]
MLRLVKEKQAAPKSERERARRQAPEPEPEPELDEETESQPQAMIDPVTGKKIRVKWYNDPYVLGMEVKRLLAKRERDQDAIDLLLRHAGAAFASPQLYGLLITGLAKKGLLHKVEYVYRVMRKRNVVPTTRTYTALLNAYAEYSSLDTTNEVSRAIRLNNAQEVYDSIPPEVLNIQHTNALLKVFVACIYEGGFESAWDLYRLLVPLEGRRRADVPEPDVVTFTSMLNICAKKGGKIGFDSAMNVWNDVQRISEGAKERAARKAAKKAAEEATGPPTNKRKGAKGEGEVAEDHQIHPDGRMLGALLLACVRATDTEDVRVGVQLAEEWLGLPSSALSMVRSKPRVPMSTQLLDVLLHLASRLRDDEMGLRWYHYATAQGLAADEAICNNVVGLLISSHQYEKAWKVQRDGPAGDYALGIRVASSAVRRDNEDKSMWFERAQPLFEAYTKQLERSDRQEWDVRPVANYVNILCAVKKWDEAYQIIVKRRDMLVGDTRLRLERIIAESADSLEDAEGEGNGGEPDSDNGKEGARRAPMSQIEIEVGFRVKALRVAHQVCTEYIRGLPEEAKAKIVTARLLQRQIEDVMAVSDLASGGKRKAPLRADAFASKRAIAASKPAAHEDGEGVDSAENGSAVDGDKDSKHYNTAEYWVAPGYRREGGAVNTKAANAGINSRAKSDGVNSKGKGDWVNSKGKSGGTKSKAKTGGDLLDMPKGLWGDEALELKRDQRRRAKSSSIRASSDGWHRGGNTGR